MQPSQLLIDWVQKQGEALPWLRLNPESGRLEFIVDNTILSDYRACPAHFFLSYVEGWRRKSISTAVEREWALDFGTLFHRMMELYYKHFREEEFNLQDFAIKQACEQWQLMKMDVHLNHKECQAMGGYPGFAAMLIQYATQFKSENERIRILATEVAFGRNREVPIFRIEDADPPVCKYDLNENTVCMEAIDCFADIFLAGRMDIIADDGYFIFPVDHKTMGSFRGNPLDRFAVDDGPTGYIYSLNKILPTIIPESEILKRNCSQIQMNLISKAIPKEGSRFIRQPLRKSTEQLEAYRLRTIQTVNHMLQDLESYVRGIGVPRDTSKCNNWYFRSCSFLDVHRQADKAGEAATLSNGFLKLPIWNTEDVQPVED